MSKEPDRLERNLAIVKRELPDSVYEVVKPFLLSAFAQRGAHRGYLLRNAPAKPTARAVWAVLQPNMRKVGEKGIAAVLGLHDAALKTALGEVMSKRWPIEFDIDAEQLTEMGVW